MPRLPFRMLLLAVLLLAHAAFAGDLDTYRRDVRRLADPAMHGRGVGTRGLDAARDLIAERFASLGLEPLFLDGDARRFTQPFEVNLGVTAVEQALGIVGDAAHAFDPAADFNPLGLSGDGTFEGEAVFVGYGSVAPEHRYDSYAGLGPDALRGKVAVAFRYEPMDDAGRSLWAEPGRGPWSDAATLANKARWAAERGAAALVVVDPPRKEGDALHTTAGTSFGEHAAVPVIHADLDVLRRILRAAGRDAPSALRGYQRRADAGGFEPDPLGVTLRGAVDLERPRATAHNVGAVLPGVGGLAGESIVVGAHYDHLGHGEIGSLDHDPQGKVHPGADDNASGAAGLLLLAQRLKAWADADPDTPRRAVVFVGFSGEERGLLGSAHLVANPDALGVPFDGVVAMINFDMIGRMTGNRAYVFGAESAAAWPALFERANAEVGLALDIDGAGVIGRGASDHATFYVRRIPAVHLFTGVHEDYHRPSDTAEKVNFEGGVKIVDLAERVVRQLAKAPERPTFDAEALAAANRANPGHGGGGGGAFLGVMPDYATIDGDAGCAITGVTPGSPAEQAGLRGGDVITAWGGQPVRNLHDLMERLSKAKPGEPATLTVRRGDETVEIEATPGRR